MAERASIAPGVLYPRRLAYRALRMALEQYGLAEMAVKLNPDDPTQTLPGVEPGEIWFYEDFAEGRGLVVSTVLLEDGRARVLVDHISQLIRRNHRRDFQPREVGIVQRHGVPDVDLQVDLREVVEVEGALMRTAKQRVLSPASRPARPPRVIRAFGNSG